MGSLILTCSSLLFVPSGLHGGEKQVLVDRGKNLGGGPYGRPESGRVTLYASHITIPRRVLYPLIKHIIVRTMTLCKAGLVEGMTRESAEYWYEVVLPSVRTKNTPGCGVVAKQWQPGQGVRDERDVSGTLREGYCGGSGRKDDASAAVWLGSGQNIK
ncbi:hypothetical protein C8R43DRAFT_1111145 [Mycena crocata]|nr:hypothetical protein C8R43DRAFT_1111145 [Mycena crocata]